MVEGWYGQPYPRPLERTREYIEIVRRARPRGALEFQGKHFQHPGSATTPPGSASR
ncbi:MAG: LLM class flavin-dependent oxidoreductase [Acidimicrobiales bacterium]